MDSDPFMPTGNCRPASTRTTLPLLCSPRSKEDFYSPRYVRIPVHSKLRSIPSSPLPSAPIRATVVKRAYESDPVTMRAAGLGLTVLVTLERPQPRSGEDERAGRRQAAGDPQGRGRAGCGWIVRGRVLVPGAWLAEWSRKH